MITLGLGQHLGLPLPTAPGQPRPDTLAPWDSPWDPLFRVQVAEVRRPVREAVA